MGADAELVKLMGPQLELLLPVLDEKARRLTLGAVARAAGDGGITAVAKATGASWQTVADGAAELESGQVAPEGRIRRPGAGRKTLAETDPGLLPALLALVADSTRGDPESPLAWTTKSAKNLAGELTRQGHRVQPADGLAAAARAGVLHPGQREGHRGAAAPGPGRPVPVYRRAGRGAPGGRAAGDQRGREEEGGGRGVRAGRAGMAAGGRPGEGPRPQLRRSSRAGTRSRTASTTWPRTPGSSTWAPTTTPPRSRWSPSAAGGSWPAGTPTRRRARLLVTCDAGGANGWRNRAWKAGLADLARETGLEITVCHFPPGTSKWNKIEHRLFSQITLAWRGRPLTSHDVIINTIAATTTVTGLTVTAVLDEASYPTGTAISDEQMTDLEQHVLTRHRFHGDWNL